MYCDPNEESKREFVDWLDNFDAVPDEDDLLETLAQCGDWLPDEVCTDLGIPIHSTYSDAVKLFRSEWSPT